MKWIEQRDQFQKRFDTLAQENVQGLITEMNQAVANYIAKSGISQDPNNSPEYQRIIELTRRAESIKNRYSSLNDDIIEFVAKESRDNNLSGLLIENGELQKQINRLEKIQEEIKIDVESAIARDELLRTRNTEITRHKLFILDRPVRRGLIPYLWVIAVLFIGVGLIIFRITIPSLGVSANQAGVASTSMMGMLIEFISNKVVLGSLLISALIVILFLSLKIAGVFGK
jgi:archaellum component FlaC